MDYNKEAQERLIDVKSLYHYLQQLEDPRSKQGRRYELASLLLLIILAKMGGEQTPSGITDWILYRREKLEQHFPELALRSPCHMTYRRVLQRIVKPEELEQLMSDLHQYRLQEDREVILTIDGKTI